MLLYQSLPKFNTELTWYLLRKNVRGGDEIEPTTRRVSTPKFTLT